MRAAPENSRYDALIQRLDRVWSLFRPELSQRFSVEPVGTDEEEGFDVFLVSADGTHVPLDVLSSGEVQLVGFVGWMVTQHFEHGIICIDEPELHLDPQWHRLMLRALRELQPAAQFIVSTHSPGIYDSAFSFQRHFLVPEGDPRMRTWARSNVMDLSRQTLPSQGTPGLLV